MDKPLPPEAERREQEASEPLDGILDADLAIPIEPRRSYLRPNAKDQPSWTFYEKNSENLQDWWDEFNNELGKDCRLKYPTAKLFAQAKGKTPKEKYWIYKTDVKTVQALLRHSDVKTTLQLYTHSVSEDRMAAQGAMLKAIFSNGTDKCGLTAD